MKPPPPSLGVRASPRPPWGLPSPDPHGLPGHPRGPLGAHEFRIPEARRERAAPTPAPAATCGFLLPGAPDSAAGAAAGRGAGDAAGAQRSSASSGRGAGCLAFSSAFSALNPREGPGPAEELNQGVRRRALCPPARHPAALICRRLLARLAILSSPLPTLPG